jgi:hypothetical protein
MYIYGYTNVFRTIYTSSTPPVDPDAQAFITAAAITDATQQSAVNQLVVDLKSYGVWTKMKAIYPFVGGTADTHKFNLKDPQDLDTAYRLTFFGGWTHSATGALPNGINGYANTHLNTNTLTLSSAHISGYSRTDSNGLLFFIGGAHNGSNRYLIWPRQSGVFNGAINSGAVPSGTTNPNSLGMYIANRVTNSAVRNSMRGSVYNITSAEAASLPSGNIFIAKPNDINSYYDNRERAFHSIGLGLTDIELTDLTNIVSSFQTLLNRNV